MQTSPFAKHRAFNKANDCGIQIDNVRMTRSCGQTPRIEGTGNITVSAAKDSTMTARVLRTQTHAFSTMTTRICFPAGGAVMVR